MLRIRGILSHKMEQKVTRKKVQNQFFDVKAPLTSSKISLYGPSMDALVGRVVRIDLSRNLRGRNLELVMKIKKEGEELVADPEALALFGSYIRRMFRKGSDYVEDSFIASCKDGDFVVKPFMLTRKKVPRSIRNSLRVMTRDYITGIMTTRTSLELFSDVMAGKIQKDLELQAKEAEKTAAMAAKK